MLVCIYYNNTKQVQNFMVGDESMGEEFFIQIILIPHAFWISENELEGQ